MGSEVDMMTVLDMMDVSTRFLMMDGLEFWILLREDVLLNRCSGYIRMGPGELEMAC
jgi:hypothetical protein